MRICSGDKCSPWKDKDYELSIGYAIREGYPAIITYMREFRVGDLVAGILDENSISEQLPITRIEKR